MSQVECAVTGGDHDWTEGGPRDRGRYHCARCQQCLNPMHVVRELREQRAEVDRLTSALRAVRTSAIRMRRRYEDGYERVLQIEDGTGKSTQLDIARMLGGPIHVLLAVIGWCNIDLSADDIQRSNEESRKPL